MSVKSFKTKPDLVDRLGNIEIILPDENGIRSTWLTVLEKRMIQASAFIRSEENWEQKLDDAVSVERWSRAARDTYKLSTPAVEYVLKELRYYAKLRESSGSDAVLTSVDMVWSTHVSADDDIAMNFKRDVASVLEKVPDQHKDWTESLDPLSAKVYFDDDDTTDEEDREDPIIVANTFSSGVNRLHSKPVLHLLDPALYRLIFSRSPICTKPYVLPTDAILYPHVGIVPGSSHSWMEAASALNQKMIFDHNDSTGFYVPIDDFSQQTNNAASQWIPYNIYIKSDRSVDIRSYINGIHPVNHAAAYKAIARVLTKTLPLFEQVLTDVAHRRDLRVSVNTKDSSSDSSNFDSWKQDLIYTEPVPFDFVEPDRPLLPYSLRNHHLQIYTKMTNIYLSPNNPSFVSEHSHVAGSFNECIIATAVYFYDISNVGNIKVKFNEAVYQIYDRTDERAHYDEILYGVSDNEQGYSVNTLGSVIINNGSIICFPNFYKRKLYNVDLIDTSKNGHIKMCEFHIVDPMKRLVSTAFVPPQQRSWKINQLMIADSPLGILPENIQHNIAKRIDTSISLDEARNLRKKMNTQHFYFEQNCGYSCEDSHHIPGYMASYNYGTRQIKK